MTTARFAGTVLLLSIAHVTPALADSSVIRGQYMAQIGGCHDCHTEGYSESAGKVPRERWLTGREVGFRGPWGVSYPSNLRLVAQKLTEEQWMVRARAPQRPPMPWFNLRDMTDDDLRSIYLFLRSLGPSGSPAPDGLPPGARVTTPYVQFTPQNLPPTAAR
ncbi:MAG: hypothetical protein R3E75_10625 [Steroidobacteraceae bacterium]|nr:cytochrome C [Nevskiaceae bacterium]